MSSLENIEKKIIEGTKLAIQRLIEKEKKEDGYLVFSDKGKVIKVKARDIKL